MKTKIIMPLMAIMLLLAACDRQQADEAAAKAAARAAKASAKAEALAAVPPILHQTIINPDDVFSVVRNGSQVHIQWVPNFSSCKSITIFRNGTGMSRDKKYKAAVLPSNRKEYDDTLPDAKAYWYWLAVTIQDGKVKNIGPLRVPSDESNTANYAPISDDFEFAVHRDSDSSVTLAWDLPNTAKYTSITILRNINPKFHKKTNPRKIVTTTKEWHGEYVDKLTDSQADYWYWIDVVRENGSTLTKGPIKAEY